jgi:hypothetical protein
MNNGRMVVRYASETILFCATAVLLVMPPARAVDIRTGFEAAEGYHAGKLTPGQPDPADDIGWGDSTWTDMGGNNADPQGLVVTAADAPQGVQ